MRYIEYLYLILALMCLIFLATEFSRLATNQIVVLLVAMGIFSFMFTFRRRRRKSLDRAMEAEMKRLQAEIDEETDT